MSKKSAFVQLIIFVVFIGVFFALNFILPDRDFSQQENRALQQAPKLTASSLFDGGFTKSFEKYAADQFPLRDIWIPMKAGCELAAGKSENNNVYYCAEDTLIKQFDAPAEEKLAAKVNAVSTLADGLDIPVYFAMIPGASELWQYKLPDNAPVDSQLDVIRRCYSMSSANNIDLCAPLAAHADEYIYYRTDHHWTSLGAYYGYQAIAAGMGFSAKSLPEYDRVTVSEGFSGTNCASSGFTWIKPDSIETFVGSDHATVESYQNGLNAQPVVSGLYNTDCLSNKDKYSFFLGGVSPFVHIKTTNSDAPSLLIVRDSYTDSLAPFLTDNFSDIYVIDLRYYKADVAQLAKEKSVDSVLVMYSVSNFCTDDNIVLLGQ